MCVGDGRERGFGSDLFFFVARAARFDLPPPTNTSADNIAAHATRTNTEMRECNYARRVVDSGFFFFFVFLLEFCVWLLV